MATSPARRAVLARRVRWLVAATISYNAVEAAVAITAGTVASSTALLGFGLDSVIEVSSAATVAWQFSARDPARREARERTALRIIAVSFFVLAGYIAVESVSTLLTAGAAEHSPAGLVLAAVSLAVMPGLSYRAAPRRPAAGFGDGGRRLQADSAVHLPVGSAARRARPEQPVRLVVGRPAGRVGDRCRGGQRGHPGLAR